MKRNNLILSTILVFCMVWVAACSNNGTRDKPKETTSIAGNKVIYTCPMHPEEVSDKPGTCPKCGMELVKKVVKAEPLNMKSGDTTKNMKH